VAVSLSDKGGVPKYTREMITIGRFGVDGDYHATEFRTNKKGETAPNHRHVTVVAAEALDAVAEALGVIIPPAASARISLCADWAISARFSPASACASLPAWSWR
jgi:hypothetical protein